MSARNDFDVERAEPIEGENPATAAWSYANRRLVRLLHIAVMSEALANYDKIGIAHVLTCIQPDPRSESYRAECIDAAEMLRQEASSANHSETRRLLSFGSDVFTDVAMELRP